MAHNRITGTEEAVWQQKLCSSLPRRKQKSPPGLIVVFLLLAFLALVSLSSRISVGAQINTPMDQTLSGADSSPSSMPLPVAPHLRPKVQVNIRDWTRRLSEEIRAVGNRTNCLKKIERFFDKRAEIQPLDAVKLRDSILSRINSLLAQHKSAVSAIVNEAEKLAVSHIFVKNLRVNYTDVHRLRNELEGAAGLTSWTSGLPGAPEGTPAGGLQTIPLGDQGTFVNQSLGAMQQIAQFTSINGGTPVPGPIEWQTPVKSVVMQTNKNFGDIPVNTSMSAIHLPLPIYAGLPEIMNGIAWSERLDQVFKRNLAQYSHVHHQYYGDHLGFLRTFPAHKWRIPRTEPDLFDARTRPWYVAGASSPKDMVILVDTSGSMTGLRREIAKGVVFEILDTLTNNDYFTVLRFSETVTPIGFPKCNNLKTPKLSIKLEEQCQRTLPLDIRERFECQAFARQLENRGQYLRDHPNVVPGKNGSYMTNEAYSQSVVNVTHEIGDAYLLPATSRNIRYLKSNFSMPTAGIANFTNALMAAFELLAAYNRSAEGAQCNQAIMLITDGAIKSHDDIFNRYNYPNSPVRIFTYMIGREVGDITHTKAIACSNRGYYAHVINLSEVREQVQKYLPVMARPLVLAHYHPTSWTGAYGDETYQVLTDWVLETKRRERARIMLNEERERLNEANSTVFINIEQTNIREYDEIVLDDELKNRIICEDNQDDPAAMELSFQDELDPLGYNELGCHWSLRKADLLTSVVKPVFDNRNSTLYFQRVLYKNIWTEQETHVRNAQLLGVAAVDLRIGDIIRAAPSHLLGPNGYAILMGPNGFLMHHPDLRALLEDPFDKQSKLLKPYFNAVDLTHLEQAHPRNESAGLASMDSLVASNAVRRRVLDENYNKVLKLREAALRRQMGVENIYLKRAIDCRRRLHLRQQSFYYGPIKDTPFTFMLALPSNYGLNKLQARLDLDQQTLSHFKPSDHELWTLHPEYRYCELMGNESMLDTVLKAVNLESSEGINYEDLTSNLGTLLRQQQTGGSATSNKLICDKDLFPALLFDAAATYERPDSFCAAGNEHSDDSSYTCNRRGSSFSNFYGSSRQQDEQEDLCAQSPDEMRSKLANIYGLEMSFLATRSGLTRVKVFDLGNRTRRLADIFIQRHNKAVDEPWYSRTVDWNMRFQEDATVITAPYNAYVRLVAKLRQRITERHPAPNDTRSNCDPMLDSGPEDAVEENSNSQINSTSTMEDTQTDTTIGNETITDQQVQNDEPSTGTESGSGEQAAPKLQQPEGEQGNSSQQSQESINIDYSQYSTYDFLDMLYNSSVHISATQTVMKRGTRQRVPVAVSGLLYDYATFARRFLNSTSINIHQLEDTSGSLGRASEDQKVELCPGGECATKCGFRNDTIDCLLVDNNGFIIVGEELPYIGRSLEDYDERLMESLVKRQLFHRVHLVDYQAICQRSNTEQAADQQRTASLLAAAQQQASSSAPSQSLISPASKLASSQLSLRFLLAFLSNLGASVVWIWSSLIALLAYQASLRDLQDSWMGLQMQWQRSPTGDFWFAANAQSAVANQSLLALLPNKTYLRPCEKTISLYETRPTLQSSANTNDHHHQHYGHGKQTGEAPEYYVTKCGCSAWYVYDAVPKTNLIMLIVNTTSACRKCESGGGEQAATSAVPLDSEQTPLSVLQQSFAAANRSAEDQVCLMLERESQLYAKRPETCYSSHPEETQIHLCGSATKSASLSRSLLLPLVLFSLLFSTLPRR